MASAVLLAADSSAEPGRLEDVETRLRFVVFASGVAVRWDGGRESPMEARGAAGGCWMRALFRRDAVSFAFFVFLGSLAWVLLLLLGSAKPRALPTDARLSDCRSELRVVGFALGMSADMCMIQWSLQSSVEWPAHRAFLIRPQPTPLHIFAHRGYLQHSSLQFHKILGLEEQGTPFDL